MTEPDRREEALETALGLFLRFGYRKTSMDEIARAVGLSRQGLYLWFPGKQALFSEMIDHLVDTCGAGIDAALSDPDRSDVERIVGAFDAYVGSMLVPGRDPAAVDELMQESVRLVGERVIAFDADFRRRVAEALTPYATAELSAEDLTRVVYLAGVGAKHKVDTREQYLQAVRLAAKTVCRNGST